MPPNHEVRMAGAHLHLYNVQFEDGGSYQCEAVNSRGKDYHAARLSVEGEICVVRHVSFFSSNIWKGVQGTDVWG